MTEPERSASVARHGASAARQWPGDCLFFISLARSLPLPSVPPALSLSLSLPLALSLSLSRSLPLPPTHGPHPPLISVLFLSFSTPPPGRHVRPCIETSRLERLSPHPPKPSTPSQQSSSPLSGGFARKPMAGCSLSVSLSLSILLFKTRT